jgi:hypothetical protein
LWWCVHILDIGQVKASKWDANRWGFGGRGALQTCRI